MAAKERAEGEGKEESNRNKREERRAFLLEF